MIRSSSEQFQDAIDELRVYTVALDADWIATEHANLTSPTFLTLGAEQQAP